MEEVVDATGAGVRRVRAVSSATPTDKVNENQRLPSFHSTRSAGNVSQYGNKLNKGHSHKKALAFLICRLSVA